MLTKVTEANFLDFREFAIGIVSILIVVFGFKYAKEIIVFMLDKLYQVFIKDNPLGI
jgi:hypothetical protein